VDGKGEGEVKERMEAFYSPSLLPRTLLKKKRIGGLALENENEIHGPPDLTGPWTMPCALRDRAS